MSYHNLCTWNPWYTGAYETPEFLELHPERRQLIQEQDIERVEAHRRLEAGQMTELEFIRLCCQQVQDLQKKRIVEPAAIDPVAAVRAALGVTATESQNVLDTGFIPCA